MIVLDGRGHAAHEAAEGADDLPRLVEITPAPRAGGEMLQDFVFGFVVECVFK
jgi:hypothetical protein